MKARNKDTGAAIIGSVERVIATVKLDPDGFRTDEDGVLQHGEPSDGAEVHWDSREQLRQVDVANDPLHAFEGERMFLDENGAHVRESEIELVEDPDAPPTPRDIKLTIAIDGLSEALEDPHTSEDALRQAAVRVCDLWADAACDKTRGGFICSKRKGHPGRHAAFNTAGLPVRVWN